MLPSKNNSGERPPDDGRQQPRIVGSDENRCRTPAHSLRARLDVNMRHASFKEPFSTSFRGGWGIELLTLRSSVGKTPATQTRGHFQPKQMPCGAMRSTGQRTRGAISCVSVTSSSGPRNPVDLNHDERWIERCSSCLNSNSSL